MPPRYAYWTILVDGQPTAFRAGAQEDLLPTFKRLQAKHASAKMMWFQNGKLWDSRLDAQEAMRARGEMGRRGDTRQGGGFRDRHRTPRPDRKPDQKLEWQPRDQKSETEGRGPRRSAKREVGLEWKPKGAFTPAPRRPDRPEWKPRGLDWKPKGEAGPKTSEKRKWVPKEEYKRSQGIAAKRDSKWRPGGEHKDPRQKYKDAKKAKWTRFKTTIRTRWEAKQGKKRDK